MPANLSLGRPQFPTTALWRAQFLQQLQNGANKAALDAMCIADLGPIRGSNLLPNGPNNTAAYVCADTPGNVLFFCAGVGSVVQAGAVATGYPVNVAQSHGSITNQWFVDAAAAINSLMTFPSPPRGQINFCGYSAGGPTVYYMQTWLTLQGAGYPPPNVALYGSPKIAGFNTFYNRTDGGMCHWMCHDDPIPRFPPSPADFPLVGLTMTGPECTRLAAFTAPSFGISIDAAGVTTPSAVPLGLPAVPVLNWSGLIWGQVSGANTPHSLATYISRLQLLVNAQPNPFTPVPNPPVNPPVVVLPPQAAYAIVQAAQQQAFIDAARQNAVPVILPQAQLFQASKAGKVWSVYFGDVQVCIAPFKRRARGLANAGNDFLRRLQNEAVVNAGDLAQQWVTYLAIASQAGGEFQPPMNTSL